MSHRLPDPTALPLPVAAILPALLAALEAGRNAVVLAPPGSGKTTLVPPALLAAPWRGADQRILVLEPRRLAARAAATRMSALRGETPGGLIGYRTRLDFAVSPATRIEVLTEGLLLRRLLADPLLDGTAAVILDEVHERSVEADLALALLRDLQVRLRPDLRLIAMSATAEAARLAALLDATVIESAGRPYPVTLTHAARDLPAPRDLPDAMAGAIRAALAAHPGDILAFLPGMAEIRRTEAALAGLPAQVLPLHGDLPPAAQDLALQPRPRRRAAGGAGDRDRRDLADGPRRAHRHRRRVPPRPAGSTPAPASPASSPPASPAPGPSSAPGGPGGKAPGWRSASGPRRCIAACPPTTGRNCWRPNCRRCASPAPSGPTCSAPRPPSCRFPTRRPPGRLPPPGRCWKSSARSIRPARSPRPGGGWPRWGRIRGWRR